MIYLKTNLPKCTQFISDIEYSLNKTNIVLVSLSTKSSGEFTVQWWTGEAGELELTKNSTNCVVRMTLWNSASWADSDGQDM